MAKHRLIPSLPKYTPSMRRSRLPIWSSGKLISRVAVELHDQIIARAQRQREEWQRANKAARQPIEPPAPYVPYEPPPAEPVTAPRIRATPHQPRRKIPHTATVAMIELDHPYDVPVAAERVAPPPGAALNGEGPAEWQRPAPVTVTVATTVRGDVVGYMFARRQINQSDFYAAREYQAAYEIAASAHIHCVDSGMPRLGIYAAGDYTPSEELLQAAAKLKHVDTRAGRPAGHGRPRSHRDVLGIGMTIEAAAEARGDSSKQSVRSWGSLFRRCLRHLSVILGYATG